MKHVLESARAEIGDEHALEPALTLRPGQSIGEMDFDIHPIGVATVVRHDR